MRIRFSPESVDDLKRIYNFIAEHDPDSARTTVLNLKSAINRFSLHPQLGRTIEHIENMRDFTFGRYVVRYTEKPDYVYILRIWHSKEPAKFPLYQSPQSSLQPLP
ncbi:type II toxin-antitoxin system RelE/ParE family toxin [Desulfovibrio sp. JC010]|uniref:type II toxin-antitoxin system RelE/ParE family toxin n=1 Tax=Desulfovibrio sp. JC010 TaxID=2593641 RepID=UPI0013D4EE7C|nr:type II toxin-antitoxin system RelE/ParE family toxin [Desulfovibrio sp. JC010]